MVSFADGHVSYIEMYWNGQAGSLAISYNPPAGYDYQWSTPIDIFIYEPFDFAKEFAKVHEQEIAPGIVAPVVSLKTLLKMKREAGRPQDLEDIRELKSIQ